MVNIPTIDPTVKHVTVGQMRRVLVEDLPRRTLVVTEDAEPLAVLLPYETFLAMQEEIADLKGTRPA